MATICEVTVRADHRRSDRRRSDHTTSFSGTDVWQFVTSQADRLREREFMAWQPFDEPATSWSYAQLVRDAASVGAGLARRGVKPGDKVIVHLDNSPEFVISWLGCAASGAVAVTTNTRSAGDEITYYAADSGAVGAITQPRYGELIARSAPQLNWIVASDHDGGVPAETSCSGVEPFSSLFADPNTLPARAVDPWAPMSVQYTSGTTSRPKGVVWTHANALWAGRCNAVHEDLHPEDRHLVYLPMFHANALGYSVLPTLWVGAGMTLIPKWSTTRFWSISMEHGCTWLSTIGLSLRALLTGATGEIPEGHRYRLLGAPVCDTRLDALLGVKSIGWWGMTETIGHGIVGNPHTPDRPMTLGRAAPEYGIAVVHDDGVTPTKPGETGNLLFKGTPGLTMFDSYLNLAEATADSFDEWGWFRTGDLVTVLDDGYLVFADRSKDMLKVGAENVAASEVERVIMDTGLVVEAAVVGRPDATLDEVPVAFVIVDGNVDVVSSVIEACSARLADFKVPRDVYVVADLPRSTLAKVNKVELRKAVDPDHDRKSAEAVWVEEARSDPSGDAVVDG